MIFSALDNTRRAWDTGRVSSSTIRRTARAISGMEKVIMKDLVLILLNFLSELSPNDRERSV